MNRAGRRGATLVALLGPVLVVLYAVSGEAIGTACLGLAALCCIGGTVAGPLLNRPLSAWPWRLIALAAILFLIGVVVRPWASVQPGAAAYTADLFSLSGYVAMLAGTALLLRSGGRKAEPHALTDGLIVCLGVACLTTVLFSLPAAAVLDRSVALSVIAGLYPVLDVVLLLLLLNLGFSMPPGLRSFRVFSLAIGMIFVGDLGYAWIGASGRLTGSRLLDLPYVVAYVSCGYAALHPSMVQMARVVPRGVQAWSPRRLGLIVPALLAPAVLLLLRARPQPAERMVIAAATAGMMILVLVRAVRAVRDHSRSQAMLLHRVTHDVLTELPNRLMLGEQLDRMLADPHRRHPVSLLSLDLDGFKLVNDTWGHETGDRLLVEVVERLHAVAGPEVTLARTGGDEFALAAALEEAEARSLAHWVLAELRRPLLVGGLDLVVTASMGIAESVPGSTAEGLLREADTAMYRAKGEGRDGWVVFDQGMQSSVRTRVEIERSLRQALIRGQFWVAYQPIVDLRTERVIGAEALLRWTHPEKGDVPPLDFIPIAEETGMIVEIGAWVLRESVSQVAAWRAEGAVDDGFHISVNVSPRQLGDDTLVAATREALAEAGLPADRLVVEITESVMLETTPAAGEALLRLRSLGVGLSVDDFGTGYSSLTYLSRFPVSGVKVDRAFVERLGGDIGDEVIVRAIGAMAGALRLGVVAEGVETARQRDVLRAIGIQHGQGWLWGKAVGAEAFAAAYRQPAGAGAGAGNSYAQ